MSIYWEKSKQRWRFDYQGTIAGRRIRARKLLPAGWSKAQAEAYARAEVQRLFATGKPETALIDQCVLLYLQDKTHLKSHRKATEHLAAIAWAYEDKPLDDLPGVARLITERESAHTSPATVRNRLALLKAACRHAWKIHALCETDPTVRMQLPPVRNSRHVYASRAEMLRIAKACDRRDVRALVRIAFYTGMRLGELHACAVGEHISLPDSKNGLPRLVPIHPRIHCCLRYLPLAAPKITLQRAFQRAREAAGLPHIHIHDLRHSAASEMINAGIDLYTVGAVLGHKDSHSTQRYAHLATQTLAEAVGRIGNYSPTSKKKTA
ncbi:MAG: tyrosine-type recombinase/integrase [Thiomonas sp.]